jgi:hypothetical protein
MAGDFRLRGRQKTNWQECSRLKRWPWVLHGFSTRDGGGTRRDFAGAAGEFSAGVARDRRLFLSALGAGDWPLASLRQIHSSLVWAVRRGAGSAIEYLPSGFERPGETATALPSGDAMVTAEPGVLLSVRSADCLPVLLVDPRRRVVAAVHGGWRGMLRRVPEKTLGVMRTVFGTDPADVRAAIGPSIRVCCYSVGQEVVEAYAGAFVETERFFRRPPRDEAARAQREWHPIRFLSGDPPGHARPAAPAAHLDLVEVARVQLRRAGVKARNVWVSEFCTACREDLFYSHRRDGKGTGRMMAVIGIRPASPTRARVR